MVNRVERRTIDYVDEVSRMLWPVGTLADRSAGRAMVALPSRSRPRMLVPAATGRVGAAAVRALAADRSARGRLRREGVATALGLGAGRVLQSAGRVLRVGAGGIDDHLSSALGRPVVSGMLVGAPRANRKPVLVLLAPSGEVVGFAKVGSTALTRALVAREADALEGLAGRELRSLQAPRLLHRGQWAEVDLVVQSPLDTARAAEPDQALLHRALRELATSVPGADQDVPLTELAGWRACVARLQAHVDELAPVLLAHARRLEVRAGSRPLAASAWHGDLTPWNVGVVDDRLLAWDWERYEEGVPLGFDALHHRLAVLTQVQGLDHETAARRLVHSAAAVTAPLGVDPDTADTVVLAYLVVLGTRYLVDGQAAAGHRVGRLGHWLLPLLAARLAAGAGPV